MLGNSVELRNTCTTRDSNNNNNNNNNNNDNNNNNRPDCVNLATLDGIWHVRLTWPAAGPVRLNPPETADTSVLPSDENTHWNVLLGSSSGRLTADRVTYKRVQLHSNERIG